MTNRVYIHIGAFKSGTTFLQAQLWACREALADTGVLFPGWRGWGDQVRAFKHVLDANDVRGEAVPAAPWDRLTTAVKEWPGATAVVSFEDLSVATAKQAARAVAGFAPADVHVVLTARDLARTIPAMWQEVLQGGQTWTWPQYISTVTSPLGRTVPPGRNFWRGHDLPKVAARWATVVGADHLHVVTVPPAGAAPALLWERFCAATGIDPSVTASEPVTVHESLDVASTELMRRVNRAAEGVVPIGVYDRVFKHLIAQNILASAAGSDRAKIPESSWAWVQSRSKEVVEELADAGYHVEGDLADLLVTGAAPPPSAAMEGRADPDAVLDAAVRVIVELGQRVPPGGGQGRRGGPRGQQSAPDAQASNAHQPAEPGTPPARPLPTVGSGRAAKLVRGAFERLRP